MPSTFPEKPFVKLSICITTFNRAVFIGPTLDSILMQLRDECEVIILDGGSSDDTERVVLERMRCGHALRYVRADVNNGIDRDYDRAVQLARGEYCWLMTDDDLLKENALSVVLDILRRDVSLIIVNAESKDLTMSKVLTPRWLDLERDRVYGPKDMDSLFREAAAILRYIGAFIIKRSLWVSREKELYYGSCFLYLGVIFQERLPGDAVVIADPLISYRTGNSHTFYPHVKEIIFRRWPSLVQSLDLSDASKFGSPSVAPWRHIEELLLLRALGLYSFSDYTQWVRPRVPRVCQRVMPIVVALIPGGILNVLLIYYYSMRTRSYRGVRPQVWVGALKEGRLHLWRRRGV